MNTEKINVAIFQISEYSINFDDYDAVLKNSVTDWTEVSLEEYEMLVNYLNCIDTKFGRLVLVRQIREDKTYMSLSNILEQVKKIADKQKQQQLKQQEESKKRAKLAEINKKKRELKKLETLKAKVAELEKLNKGL